MICYSYSHLPLLTFKIFVCYETEVKWRFRFGVWSVLSQKLIPWSVVLKTRHKDMIKIYVDCWCLPCLTSPQDQQLQLAKWNNSPEILSFYAVYTKRISIEWIFLNLDFFRCLLDKLVEFCQERRIAHNDFFFLIHLKWYSA